MLRALDSETNGTDFYHGAKPFFITTCTDEGEQQHWEFDVDPLTREPKVPRAALEEILMAIEEADELVLQNAKFDVTALKTIDAYTEWPWGKTHDTLNAGHLLASNQPHNLTDMAMHYLGIDIEPLEKALEKAVKECRTCVRRHLPEWRLAAEDDPTMPSATDKVWKFDTWAPLALCKWAVTQDLTPLPPLKAGGKPIPRWYVDYAEPDHPWRTVLRDYANADSSVTVMLWQVMRRKLEERGLWKIYEEVKNRPYLAHRLETVGVTLSACRLEEQVERYSQESITLAETCEGVAAEYGYELKLPKGGRNHNLQRFMFEVMELPVLARTPAGNPAMDRATMVEYLRTLDEESREGVFVKTLLDKRSRDTACQYMKGYKRFWLDSGRYDGDTKVLHPSLNPTGTDTTRWSSNNPNEQNVSAKDGFNLRYAFGPAPGREWWDCDAKNIELRIPAYECGEEAFIDLFEHPDDPPYYGSNHMLVCHLLHPELFEACVNEGVLFKDKHKALYKRVKNGNFAIQYGCQERKADATYGVNGAYRLIASRFYKQAALNKHWIQFAEKYGYVETMPDRSVDPEHGYPLLCTRTEWGKILPTVPLSYHVQGTACWWMLKAMRRCQAQLNQWNQLCKVPDQYRMVLQVHDSIVFDFPKKGDPRASKKDSNLGKIRILQGIMETGGDDVGVPTPSSATYHPDNWSEGVDF